MGRLNPARASVAVAVVIVAALSGLATLTGAAHAGTAGSPAAVTLTKACRAWTGRHPPYAIWLTGVVALSPCDIWATGVPGVSTQSATVTDLLHWNGATWTLRTGSTVPAALQPVPSVTATSARDVWVAGGALIDINPEGLGVPQTLIAHWNGAALRRVPSPDPAAPPGGLDELSGVSATAGNDIWTVGSYTVPDSSAETSQTYPLAEHWNGSAWTQVPAAIPRPNGYPTPYAGFYAVQARCGCATWAVGQYDTYSAPRNSYRLITLAERWGGGAWHLVASPNLAGDNKLDAVSADSATDGWAVGYHEVDSDPSQTLTEHWNGHAWKTVPSPSPGRVGGRPDGVLLGVAAISPRDAWAVGRYDSGSSGKAMALLLHWNGASWRQVALPHAGPRGEPNVLLAVSASSAGNVVAAGYYSGHVGAGQQALLFRVG